ncbi:MAG: hypothetical protein KAV87_47715 [Desulfobacteraceae bacterium]|nr:hypothetical protein [Desulfobacteraceae bacterium]
MFSPPAIKATLAALGVKNLCIKFDCERKNIEARFQLHGADLQKQISFQEIEDVFTDSDSANIVPPRIDESTLEGG